MAVLSKQLAAKLLGSEWSFGYNCYEVGHTWTPSCTAAALEVSLAAALKVAPLYAMLYSFSQLAVAQQYDLPASIQTLKSTLRSSFFIFFHAYNGSLMGCALRHSFGRFYYRVLVCAPALLSSYFSLLIEKPSRRQALAFYLLNMASEIVYRMAVTKGYFSPVRHGETLVFASSLAAWYYLIKSEGFGHDPVSGAMKVLVGRDEATSRSKRGKQVALDLEHQAQPEPKTTIAQACRDKPTAAGLGAQLARFAATQLPQKHPSCPHSAATCFEYVLGPVPSRFLIGYAIQSMMRVARNPFQLYFEPVQTLRDSLASRASVKFGLFLASLVSGGRLASCLLRHHSNANLVWHGAASGFVAGLSMLWAPRSSLSMYVMWKAVEQYYLLAAQKGQVKYVDLTIQSIYSLSAATILYTFALEPRFVRPSYMKFLDNLSDHRLHQLNRMVLDVFGTGSSIGYEDYFPDLDPSYMSNQFQELVFNWMIQPYE